jgi:hypothetical protein
MIMVVVLIIEKNCKIFLFVHLHYKYPKLKSVKELIYNCEYGNLNKGPTFYCMIT